jgi:tol-pal system beta propeller repeat protein TolB
VVRYGREAFSRRHDPERNAACGLLGYARRAVAGACVTSGGKTTANIYLMDSENSDPGSTARLRKLTNSAWNDQASWSPDGRRIVYTRESTYNGATSQIMVMNADGSHQTPLTAQANADSVPCFSPDGTRIAFRRDQSGTPQIYVMSANGSNQHNISNDASGDISPVWSPDGRKIAYAAADGNVWVMKADGSRKHPITHLSASTAAEPAWSPDGAVISYSGNASGNFNIWLMNADGSHERQLTFDTFDVESYWAPDGTKILFDYVGGGSAPTPWPHLGVINRDGSDQRDLTPKIPKSGIEPAWQPIAHATR